ncbi:MAG: O-antigen ligase family protein [Ignavibacteriae bacterium]|nr:O-antigen ligase family protein [Ignavibacteriota bacterium]
MSLFKANNLIAMILVMTSIPIVLKRRTDLYFILYIYLLLTAIDSIYVIVNGIITGGRVFGFSGVFYVDLSGIGALISIILFIYERHMKKIIFGLLMILITTGLIFTQTRNAWLSTGLSLFIIILLLLIKSVKFYVKKSKIIKILTVIIVTIIGIYFISSQASAGIEDRISSEESSQVITDDPGSVSSSYVSRLFIWHTAYNAFAQHPFIGIGFYSFSFSSHLYYTIPKSFYKTFVMERTPHVTWIAVLTETGIVGLIGFIFLVFTIIKIGIKELNLVSKPDDAKITVVIIGIQLYILISMFMTDAWLWGQQVVLWGITLGMSVSNYNLLLANMKHAE